MIGDDDHPEAFVAVNVDNYQELTEMEDLMADILLCLDSTVDTITTLRSISNALYDLPSQLPNSEEATSTTRRKHIFNLAFGEKEREVLYTRQRAEALLSKVKNTSELVSIAGHGTWEDLRRSNVLHSRYRPS